MRTHSHARDFRMTNDRDEALRLADILKYQKASGIGTVRSVRYWTAKAKAMLETSMMVDDFRAIAKLIEAIEMPARIEE